VCDVLPERFPQPADSLPMMPLLRACVLPSSEYDVRRIEGIREAVVRLRGKSRSFYLASSVFPGRIRIDLTLLYSYCRLADDLIDNAESPKEALEWISKLKGHLGSAYRKGESQDAATGSIREFIRANDLPPSARTALELLPSHIVSKEPLYALLEGFRTDVGFSSSEKTPALPVIQEESDLELYASRVAGTIGEMCLDIVLHHSTGHVENEVRDRLYAAAREMGIALQYINIARDVAVDAAMGRAYLPASWLAEEGLTQETVLAVPRGPAVDRLRRRLLGKAFERYRASRGAMEMIPREGRAPMMAAVESYMEIGRVLAEGGLRVEGKATVPIGRRFRVVWKALVWG